MKGQARCEELGSVGSKVKCAVPSLAILRRKAVQCGTASNKKWKPPAGRWSGYEGSSRTGGHLFAGQSLHVAERGGGQHEEPRRPTAARGASREPDSVVHVHMCAHVRMWAVL